MKPLFLVGLLLLTSVFAYRIVGDMVVEENEYGKIEVWPHTAPGFLSYCQYMNVTSFLPDQNLDVSVKEVSDIKNLKVLEWKPVSRTVTECNACLTEYPYNDKVLMGIVADCKACGSKDVVVTTNEWVPLNSFVTKETYQNIDYNTVKAVTFKKDSLRQFMICYESDMVKSKGYTSSGKWEAFVKPNTLTMSGSTQSGLYMNLDPWWNTSYAKRKEINVTDTSFMVKENQPLFFNVTVSGVTDCYKELAVTQCDATCASEHAASWNITTNDVARNVCEVVAYFNLTTGASNATHRNATDQFGYVYYACPSCTTDPYKNIMYFRDEFNGTSLDGSKWYPYGTIATSVAGGIITVQTTGAGDSGIIGYVTNNSWSSFVFHDRCAPGATNRAHRIAQLVNNTSPTWTRDQMATHNYWSTGTAYGQTSGSIGGDQTVAWAYTTAYQNFTIKAKQQYVSYYNDTRVRITHTTASFIPNSYPIVPTLGGTNAAGIFVYCDFVRIYSFVAEIYPTEGTITLGSEESSTGTIQINYPTNTSYETFSFAPQYTPSMNALTTSCYTTVDGSSTAYDYNATVYNATLTTSASYTFSTTGQHNVTVICSELGTNVTQTQYFTILDYGIGYRGYLDKVYETSNQTFWLEVDTLNTVLWINASLYHGGDLYTVPTGIFTSSGGGTGTWNFTKPIQMPLIFVNQTGTSFTWNLNVSYTNGTSYAFNDTATSQTLWESFYGTTSISSQYTLLPGQSFSMTGNVAKLVNNGEFDGYFEYNGTNNTASVDTNSSSLFIFDQTFIAPYVLTATTYTVYPWANVSWNPTKVMNFTPFNLTVTPVNVTNNCTDAFIVVNSTEEETQGWGPTIDLDVGILLYSGSTVQRSNYTFTGNNTYCIQLSPTWAVLLADVEMEYKNTTSAYAPRMYFLDQTTLSNVTQYVTLYTEPLVNTTNIKFSIKDLNDIDQPNVTVKAQRYFISGTLHPQYKTVAMCKSDEKGECNMWLRTNQVWYTLNLESNGTILNTYDRIYIIDTELTLRTADPGYGIWRYNGTLARSCDSTYVDPSSTLVTCAVSDTTGASHTWTLHAQKDFQLSNITTCTQTLVATSGSLTCNVTDPTGIYSWRLMVDYQNTGDMMLVESGSLDYTSNPLYGTAGVLATIFLVITATTFASFSPAVLPFGPVIALWLAVLLHLIYMPYELLIGATFLAAVFAWKVKT